MPDPWTDAWAEAEVTGTPGVEVYQTLELIHPAFVDAIEGAFSIRAVAETYVDQKFTLEPGAPLNGGEEVDFKAIPFSSDMPEIVEGKTPECTISVDNVGEELEPYIEAAAQMRADMIAILRQYRDDDRSEPCYGPVFFVIKNVTVTGSTVTGTAKIDDLANRKFPSRFYNLGEYKALTGG